MSIASPPTWPYVPSLPSVSVRPTTALPRGGRVRRFRAGGREQAGFDVLTFPDHLVAIRVTVRRRDRRGARDRTTACRNPGAQQRLSSSRRTARETAGVATVTDGRFELGIGAGHMKSEYDAAGLTFDSGGDAGRPAGRVGQGDPTRCSAARRSTSTGRTIASRRRRHLVAAPDGAVPMLIGGNGTRVLQLAGRSADIVGLAGSATTATPPRSG